MRRGVSYLAGRGSAKEIADEKMRLYVAAMQPARKRVSSEEFEQVIYDAVARDATMTRESILRWAKRNYEVIDASSTPSERNAAGREVTQPQTTNSQGRAASVFAQSNGDVTKAYYAELCQRGPIGMVAMNLFRAQKTSSRAKVYRRRSDKQASYERKQYSLNELCRILGEHGEKLGIRWGWKIDPKTLFGQEPSHVLYADLNPDGQVSFHSPNRGVGPDYSGEWDQVKDAVEGRILAFCDRVMSE